MLINSVILVLREVLEASLLVSLLLVLSHIQNLKTRWIVSGLGFGFVTAAIYALTIGVVSQWFDGTGQEIINAVLQGCIYLMILAIVAVVLVNIYINKRFYPALPVLMVVTVALAIAREGSEILIYLSGFLGVPDLFDNVIIGSLIGASIGCSIGALFYYVLVGRSARVVLFLSLGLLALVSAGMMAQATQLLMQADYLPSHSAVWNTSDWISEASIVGQLLYALIGYEATPTLLQALVYGSSILAVLGVTATVILNRKQMQ